MKPPPKPDPIFCYRCDSTNEQRAKGCRKCGSVAFYHDRERAKAIRLHKRYVPRAA